MGVVASWPWSRHTFDLNLGAVVTTQSQAWHCRSSAGTDWPGISILWPA